MRRAPHTATLVTVGLVGLVSLATTSCTKPNPDACASNADCAPGQTCNPDLNVCEQPDVDAAPIPGTCAASTNQCVPAPPDDWEGPFAVFDTPSGDDAPACPDGYPDTIADLKGDFSATGSCECTCDPATDVSCATDVPPRLWNASVALGRCIVPANQPNPVKTDLPLNGDCVGIGDLNSSAEVIYDDPGISGGTCASQTLDTLETSFDRATRVCGNAAVSAEGCRDNELCAPRADAEDGILCIAKEGDHDCPDQGAFTRRLLRYTGDRDQRQCECSCGTPDGTCGEAALVLACDTQILVAALANFQCYEPEPGDLSYGGLRLTGSPSGTCEPVKTDGGTAEPVAPTTLCCLP